MDGVGVAWRSGDRMESGRSLAVPPNYGGQGGFVEWDWTPTMNYGYIEGSPHNPQSNELDPIIWNLYVVTTEEQSALAQAGLLQTIDMLPATVVQPGTASLSTVR